MKRKIAIAYHFFAHYRGAIMQSLLDSSEFEYILAGDKCDPYGSIKAWDVPGERFIFLPCIKLPWKLLWQKGLVKLALRRDLDSIIFLGNANWPSTWIAAFLAHLTGKRVLFWTHGWRRQEKGVKAVIRRWFYRLGDGLLLYGNWAKFIGIGEGFPSTNLYVIYNSLDYEAQKSAREHITYQQLLNIRKKYCTRVDVPMLIFTGRITQACRLDLLLHAMSVLKAESLEISLLVVGDGPERASLEAMAKKLGLYVHFFGACYDETILAELIMTANVMVSPGKIGLAAIHSLAYGTPVISHDDASNQGPEFEAIVSGKTGDFFRHDDSNDLARVIRRWITFPWPNNDIRQACVTVMERYYTPELQKAAINQAVAGFPATELDLNLLNHAPWFPRV